MRYGTKEGFEEIVNQSVNETLARSFNTSFTVLLVLGAILFFGGATIQAFSLALLIGVIAGTYSSIFIASALLVSSYKTWKRANSS
jgi:preprotein translocase subunit SecF